LVWLGHDEAVIEFPGRDEGDKTRPVKPGGRVKLD
jgi:hypothetical protein